MPTQWVLWTRRTLHKVGSHTLYTLCVKIPDICGCARTRRALFRFGVHIILIYPQQSGCGRKNYRNIPTTHGLSLSISFSMLGPGSNWVPQQQKNVHTHTHRKDSRSHIFKPTIPSSSSSLRAKRDFHPHIAPTHNVCLGTEREECARASFLYAERWR